MSSNDFRKTVGKWLEKPYEWRIPVYQRHYAWEPGEKFGPTQLFWEIVEEQAEKRLKEKHVDPHYFGAILVENKTEDIEGLQKGLQNYDVVDGQQRLTTINVAMFAIIEVAGKFDCKKEIRDRLAKYVFNNPQSENQSQKLIPTNFDRIQFGNLLSSAFDLAQPKYQVNSNQAKKSRIVQACDFFSEVFEKFVKERGVGDEFRAINTLIDTIVDGFELILIPLAKTDESQKVFESLNNTAKPLTTFDLIRNNVFYRAGKDPGSDIKLFDSPLWQQFEDTFWEKHPGRSDENTHIEAYIARMLIVKKEEKQQYLLMDRNSIFKEYKKFAEIQKDLGISVSSEIEIISEYVNIYKYLVGEIRKNPLGDDFNFGYFMHKTCKSMDFYPALFTICCSSVSTEEKQQMVYLLESFVIRRHICKLTPKHYNRLAPLVFYDSNSKLEKKPSYEALYEFLKDSQAKDTRLFPGNDRIESACISVNFYARNKLMNYIFDRIVASQTRDTFDEKRDTKGLTVDHILPVAWRDKDGWKNSLADFAEEDIDIKINTIGNLTPMSKGLNSAKSNHDWDGEKGARAWLSKCDLKLTRNLAEKESWNLSDISARSKELAAIICQIWPEDVPLEV